MDIEAAAVHLGVSTKTLRRWIGQGKLAARQIPGPKGMPRYSFSAEDLDQVKRELLHPEVMPEDGNGKLDISGQSLPAIVQESPQEAIVKRLDIIGGFLKALTEKLDISGHLTNIDEKLSRYPLLLTTKDVSELLGCSESGARRLCQEGAIRALKGVRRGWNVKHEDLKRYLDEL